MLATLPGRLVGVDDGLSGTNGQVLGITGETHQQQITGRTVGDGDTIQAGLRIE